MRIVALEAVRASKRLSLVSLDERIVFHVVAIDTKRRNALGEMVIELNLARFPGLMGYVAGVAAHIERGVSAAFRRHIQSLSMAIEAQVFALFTAGRFQQLVLVIRLMRIVAFNAIAHRRGMHGALQCGGVLIGMASQAER